MHFAELDSDKWEQYARGSSLPGRWVYRREARKLFGFEDRLARSTDLNLVVSEVERGLFVRRIPGVRVEVLPNGVDLRHFRPGEASGREPETLIFTGVMHYRPNVDGVLHFADRLWPRIRDRHPNARFLVVGTGPTRAVRRLARRPGIEVSGRVPSTVPWFERASLCVVPLRIARGVQNKVLEGMAMGLPVVATERAFKGIRAEPGRDLLVCRDDESFLEGVLGLLADREAREEMGRRAREAMEASYDWAPILERMEEWCG